MTHKVLFIVPYPITESPSQRFRFEQYFDLLSTHGVQFQTQSFLSSANWRLFYGPGKTLKKAAVLSYGLLRRASLLLKVHQFDFVFIHREAAPLGPPMFEWILSKVFKKKIIYDFDDAIWLTDRINEPRVLRLLKWRKKVGSICRWSYKVSCGNDFLASYARRYNANVVTNPTTIDTNDLHNPSLYSKTETKNHGPVIGWTGSHSTLKYLNDSIDVLRHIEQRFPDVKFVVIADRKPNLHIERLHFVSWNTETEITDLMQFDIGIMPLPDDTWAKGKCGFKALQYLALKIPTVASAVGVNTKIIDHGQNGYLCTTIEEWILALTTLIENKELRKEMGERGREKIINSYSVASNSDLFLKLFE
jgi:glycosyltransferase involved in cell wall biosynthesis